MASSKDSTFVIKGLVFTALLLKRFITGANCPQREPSTVISLITTGARFKPSFAAIVLFRTSVPRGLVRFNDVSMEKREKVCNTQTDEFKYEVSMVSGVE